MSGLGFLRKLPEALGHTIREPDGVVHQSKHRGDQATIFDAASLVSGLFEECPRHCIDGRVMSPHESGECYDECACSAGYVTCPSCRGYGMRPSQATIERMANAIEALPYDTLELRNWGEESVADPYAVVAEAALWAMLEGET